MALKMTETTARLTLVVGLSIFTASCANRVPTASVPDLGAATGQAHTQQSPGIDNALTSQSTSINANDLEDDAPAVYTVVRGDTLWDISDRFLKEPWRWTEIWDENPQIENPHLIYPGDVLTLDYINGRPSLSLTRNTAGVLSPSSTAAQVKTASHASNGGRVQLAPRIRAESLEEAIPLISSDSIGQFLVHTRVVTNEAISDAPYIVGNNDDRLFSSIGSKVYARGRINRNETQYGVFRKNKVLIDPQNGRSLGYEIVHVADAKLLSVGKPSTLVVTQNIMETRTGDVLIPLHGDLVTHNFEPRLPELSDDARIVSLVDAISQSGRNQVVVLNIGAESSIVEGDVLAIETRGDKIIDRRSWWKRDRVALPNQRTGVVMVFKTFDKVSYALVMESTRPIKVNDIVTGI
jgi:hypothetical protein